MNEDVAKAIVYRSMDELTTAVVEAMKPVLLRILVPAIRQGLADALGIQSDRILPSKVTVQHPSPTRAAPKKRAATKASKTPKPNGSAEITLDAVVEALRKAPKEGLRSEHLRKAMGLDDNARRKLA